MKSQYRLALVASALLTGSAMGQQPPSKSLNAAQALRLMSPGLNLGNTLEAIPKETSWGNPVPTEAYFRGVRSAGFRSVRLPVAWSQYADANNRIDAKWMAHIKDVVRMARKADLYVMINIHWDGGWIQPTYAKQQAVRAKLRIFWSQIAADFRNFDHHLLFAGTNEIGVEGVYGPPTPENAEVQNGYNQLFVDTVRATGGENAKRMLVVQGYNTDIDAALKVNTKLPKDTGPGRLMMEVHFYSPYNFTLNEKSDIWQWGKSATDPKATETWSNEDYIDSQFAKMKAAFVDKGVPVILGEYSAGLKPKFPGMNSYRLLWDEFVTQSAYRHGMIPMYWDTGSIIDRTSGKPKDAELVKRLGDAGKTDTGGR